MRGHQAATGCDDSIRQYLNSIHAIPMLSRAEEHALAVRVSEGDEEARERLIAANLRLVVSIAKRYAGKDFSLLDLAGEGNLGLIRAVEYFDPTSALKLSTYATWWIRQSIARFIDGGGIVKVPTHMRRLISRWRRAESLLLAELGRRPTVAEIAGRLDVAGEQLVGILQSLEALAGPDTGGHDAEWDSVSEAIADGYDAVVEEYQDAAEVVEQILGRVEDGRLREVVSLRFGLGDHRPRSTRELADALGLTQPKARELEAQAMACLRGLAGSMLATA